MPDSLMDWEEVVKRTPKGYLEINSGFEVVQGPIESVTIGKDNFVEIRLAWTARCEMLSDKWVYAGKDVVVRFPNLRIPCVVEDTPEKGHRVCLDAGLHILFLYLSAVKGVDPARVEGLQIST